MFSRAGTIMRNAMLWMVKGLLSVIVFVRFQSFVLRVVHEKRKKSLSHLRLRNISNLANIAADIVFSINVA